MAVLGIAIMARSAWADMALYINGGVANLNPTIGLNAEFQYGYASIALGAGVMALNDFGFGTGLRGYLFGIDGGPYLEALYGTTAEKAITHTDSNDKEIIDSVTVYRGISGLLGWRFFFGDGWNMTLGAGAAQADNKPIFVFNLTAGIMVFGDEGAQKNAEKYGRSYKPPEPDTDNVEPAMPGPDDGAAVDLNIPATDMDTGIVMLTPTAESVTPAAGAAAPELEALTQSAVAITPSVEAITQSAQGVTTSAEAVTPAVKATAKPAAKGAVKKK